MKKQRLNNSTLVKSEFLAKYRISPAQFNKTGLQWTNLGNIYEDYIELLPSLKNTLSLYRETLLGEPSAHSVRGRIKDPEHLIEKIIRKKIAKPDFEINTDNYRSRITDLIGVRVLHLFKENWLDIHKLIIKRWIPYERPFAYIRKGDSDDVVKSYSDNNLKTKEHPNGYRSVHYVIKSFPHKEAILAEIQVRSILEEAWSEIDHMVRYPYIRDSPDLERLLLILNRLIGSADELGSFVIRLRRMQETYSNDLIERDHLIKEQRIKIESLKITASEKNSLLREVEEITKNELRMTFASGLSLVPMENFPKIAVSMPASVPQDNQSDNSFENSLKKFSGKTRETKPSRSRQGKDMSKKSK